jgi:fatty acid desaturase
MQLGAKSAGARSARPRLFAHSPLDALMVALTLAQLALVCWAAARFPQLGPSALALFVVAHVLLTVTHYSVVMHNFIHLRFFAYPVLNAIYSTLGSITMMTSTTLLGIEHFNHHRHVNDAKDPATGTTKDGTSTFRYGIDERHESLWRYVLLTPLRELWDTGSYYGLGSGHRARTQVTIETAALIAFWVAIVAFDWRFAAFYCLVVYAGLVASSAQNYLEHYGATPGNRLTDSVSCYDPIYNLLWFNNGYHQEHHYRPDVHWTKIKQVRKEMLPTAQRRVVRWGHFANLPLLPERWALAKSQNEPRADAPHRLRT